jgi:hypothetical protein
LSINSQESNSPQRNGSETVPSCNTSPEFPSFFGTTYPRQVHGVDIFALPSSPQDERDAYVKGVTLFSSALDQWLSCYTPTSSGGDSGQKLPSGKHSCFFQSFCVVQRIDWDIETGQSLLTSILLASFLSIVLA